MFLAPSQQSSDALSRSPPSQQPDHQSSLGSAQAFEPFHRSENAWHGHWGSEADTQIFAGRLAAQPAMLNATITLHGDLGAGKTTFVRHLLRALGVQGRIKSPTYAVVEPHEALPCPLMPTGEPLQVWHFDFYRFSDPREWEDAGFRELFASPGLKLVEWPERAAGHLPPIDAELHLQTQDMPQTLTPEIEEAPPTRQVAFIAMSPVGERLLSALNAI